MTTEQTAMATKQDLMDFMKHIDASIGSIDKRVDDLRFDMAAWKDELHLDMETWKEELKLHFDFVAENLRHDYLSANHDEVENLKTRVTRLERKTGLIKR